MAAAMLGCWSLLLGVGLLMLGNGLQGTLLGVRAGMEGFATATTGAVMTCYYLGFFAGSILAPRLVRRVGHIRVFAALASIASVAVLYCSLFVDPYSWAAMRLISGFAMAGLYVVAESWLNDQSSNETRGRLLSIYMVIQLAGMAGAQMLLNVGDPGGFELFLLISVLVSVALVPILLTVAPAPRFDAPARLGLRSLLTISPLGVIGCMGVGMAHGGVFGMGAVYAERAGLSVAEISIFMAAVLIGGVLLQWPIGRLSDRFDRRIVITLVTFAAAAAALGAYWATAVDYRLTVLLFGLFGGFSLPLYSLCLAHANDYLEHDQMVSASAGLVMISGLGACIGPLSVALAMSSVGPQGFYWYLTLIHGLIGLFALYRMSQRRSLPREEQGPYVAIAPRASSWAAAVGPSEVREQLDREAEEDAAPAPDLPLDAAFNRGG